jgi:serine/threonine protein kinase
MDADLEKIYNLIIDSVGAEEVFGSLADPAHEKTPEQMLQEKFIAMQTIVKPENYNNAPDDKELAWDADQKLCRFFENAKELLSAGFYGAKRNDRRLEHVGKTILKTPKREYYIGESIAEGTISTVFEGSCLMGDNFAGNVVMKIANTPADNELMWREKRVLATLHAANGVQRKHLPTLLDHFQTKDGRLGFIFRRLDDSLDLVDMRELYRGTPYEKQKHMVWMLNRTLSAIGYAHSLGIVHGNIEPGHLFFHPKDHNLFIIDWCWSAVSPKKTGDTFRIVTDRFSAPEVKTKGSPKPSADLYSIGKCMIEYLGGDTETNEMPDDVEEELQRMLQYFVLESSSQRPQDAWEMHSFLNKLVKKLWGRKRFLAYPL